jgi:hypothetical protein
MKIHTYAIFETGMRREARGRKAAEGMAALGRGARRDRHTPLSIDFIKVCRVAWPTDLSPSDGGAYAQL